MLFSIINFVFNDRFVRAPGRSDMWLSAQRPATQVLRLFLRLRTSAATASAAVSGVASLLAQVHRIPYQNFRLMPA